VIAPDDVTPGAPAPGQPTADRVQGIFSRVAGRYDLLNILLSFGLDRLWRRSTVRMAGLTPESAALDLCAGTGDLTLALATLGHPASVTGTDFVPEMLQVAERKLQRYDGTATVTFSVADAQDLPFGDGLFDVVTVGFGVRNLPDRAANFREVLRVLKPGGRYLILEFSTPPNAVWRALYRFYNRTVVPLIGGIVSGDRASYQYLNDSILRFPDQEHLASELRAAGFTDVSWRNLTGGIVAVHRSVK
jgi:demethylmenaquinone methyltransferase / 2-methoxy-6-polyprenyl-1,4-benzoquinol methylase